MGKDRFSKYGQVFDIDKERESVVLEPESPYDAAPYVSPEKRQKSPVADEMASLDEMRPSSKNHWD